MNKVRIATLVCVLWSATLATLSHEARAAVHPEGDCCWGPGCSLSVPIHQAEEESTFPITCQNYSTPAGVAPTIGRCSNDYVGQSHNSLECDVSGCKASGRLRCTGPGYPVHPPFALNCPGKTIGGEWELPHANAGQEFAACLYSDGTGMFAQCKPDGGSLVECLSAGCP